MTLDNDKMHLCGSLAALKSSSTSLLVLALLLFGVTNLHAQEGVKKKGWALKSKASSERVVKKTELADAEPEVEVSDLEIESIEAKSDAALDVESNLSEPGGNAESAIDANDIDNDEQVAASGQSNSSEENDDQVPPVKDDSPVAIPDSENSLVEYDITVGAAPINIPPINIQPVATLSPELRDSLERQFQEIQTLKETEDAFSEQLGESYLAYGRILMQAGRIDESRKMLVNALHIAKINNGVNSIEQRPILRELFEMNFALGNAEETEDHLRRVIWLEKKQPENKDIYSFDMVVRLGNHYLDLYLNNPVVSELSLNHLNKSTRYLSYAVNRYGDRPLSEVLLPYGELALAHHIKSRLQHEVDRSFYQDTRQRSYTDLNRSSKQQPLRTNSFSRSEGFLKDYLRKAKNERDLINTIQALLSLGDLNLMSDRINAATKYYDLAWTGAQNLPATHPMVESFNEPVKLPSFNFSVVRKPNMSEKEFEVVPISINIDDDGKVRKVAREALIDTSVSTTTRARRIAKRIRFRPIIENGKLIPVNDYRYEVQVAVRKSKAVAAKGPAE